MSWALSARPRAAHLLIFSEILLLKSSKTCELWHIPQQLYRLAVKSPFWCLSSQLKAFLCHRLVLHLFFKYTSGFPFLLDACTSCALTLFFHGWSVLRSQPALWSSCQYNSTADFYQQITFAHLKKKVLHPVGSLFKMTRCTLLCLLLAQCLIWIINCI